MHGTKVLWERGLLVQDAAIVGEPSELQVGIAERGAPGSRRRPSRAAHGSQPHRGVNAITSMARFLLRLSDALPDLEHPLVGRPTVNAALIAGGSAPNVVPDRCEVDIDRRTVPGESDPDAVRTPFLALVESMRAEHPEVEIEIASGNGPTPPKRRPTPTSLGSRSRPSGRRPAPRRAWSGSRASPMHASTSTKPPSRR